jgi:hypothetical protein
MAGDYRVSFDFLEIANFAPDAMRDRPYQSWGTERVYLDRDEGTYISLVHILEMRIVQADGSLSEPIVQKHWRQDWQYEPRQLVEFKGRGRWERRPTTLAERRRQWSQTISQTDESPRYASFGHWQHRADFSTWLSADTSRPLPRREAARSDYQVLLGTNRISVVATGWLQEENNLKTVLSASGQLNLVHPYRAREYGVARYERLRDADFAAATQYFERTRRFWLQVHNAWAALFSRQAWVRVREPSDADGDPYARLSEYADELASGHASATSEPELIRTALASIAAPARESRRD